MQEDYRLLPTVSLGCHEALHFPENCSLADQLCTHAAAAVCCAFVTQCRSVLDVRVLAPDSQSSLAAGARSCGRLVASQQFARPASRCAQSSWHGARLMQRMLTWMWWITRFSTWCITLRASSCPRHSSSTSCASCRRGAHSRATSRFLCAELCVSRSGASANLAVPPDLAAYLIWLRHLIGCLLISRMSRLALSHCWCCGGCSSVHLIAECLWHRTLSLEARDLQVEGPSWWSWSWSPRRRFIWYGICWAGRPSIWQWTRMQMVHRTFPSAAACQDGLQESRSEMGFAMYVWATLFRHASVSPKEFGPTLARKTTLAIVWQHLMG